jgi:hypothetical protein
MSQTDRNYVTCQYVKDVDNTGGDNASASGFSIVPFVSEDGDNGTAGFASVCLSTSPFFSSGSSLLETSAGSFIKMHSHKFARDH